MIAPTGNKSLLVVGLVALVSLVGGGLLVRSDSVTDCLDEFKRERDRRQELGQLPDGEFCRNSESQLDWLKNIKLYHSGGQEPANYMEAAIQYMDARDRLTRSMIIELVKSLGPICGSFMSNVVWQIESKYSLKNEYTLRQTIDRLVTASDNNLKEMIIDDDFYPYCHLMTFDDVGQLIEEIQTQLDDKNWPVKEYDVIYARESQLKECLDALEQAYFDMDKEKYRLAEVFSQAVSSFRERKSYNYIFVTFFYGGIEPLLISRELSGYWKPGDQAKLIAAMREKYGKKRSSSEIAELIRSELAPACGAFFGKFKDVFQTKYTRDNSGAIINVVEKNEDLGSVRSFVKVWGIYHDCYFLFKGDFEGFSRLIADCDKRMAYEAHTRLQNRS